MVRVLLQYDDAMFFNTWIALFSDGIAKKKSNKQINRSISDRKIILYLAKEQMEWCRIRDIPFTYIVPRRQSIDFDKFQICFIFETQEDAVYFAVKFSEWVSE